MLTPGETSLLWSLGQHDVFTELMATAVLFLAPNNRRIRRKGRGVMSRSMSDRDPAVEAAQRAWESEG